MSSIHSEKNVATIPSASDGERFIARPTRSYLEALPRELKDEIVLQLPLPDLKIIRLVSRDLQVSALSAWRPAIPLAKRAALTVLDPRPSAATWRLAWLSECKHLETLGSWGVPASQACNLLPAELNPFDVELQCCQWLASETAMGNSRAEQVLEELFNAIQENESALDWSWRHLHSLPPFVNKIQALSTLYLNDNQLK